VVPATSRDESEDTMTTIPVQHTLTNQMTPAAIHEPLAEIERQLITAYVAGAGQDLRNLLARSDEAARRLLADASRHASAKLSEIEARSNYLRGLHGEPR
jgi:hypothetical protein